MRKFLVTIEDEHYQEEEFINQFDTNLKAIIEDDMVDGGTYVKVEEVLFGEFEGRGIFIR